MGIYTEAVCDVLPQYGGRAAYCKVDILEAPGKTRFLELSCALFGETGVYQHHRLAPIPSLFVDGELCFDAIPSRDELEAAIEENLVRKGQTAETEDLKRRGDDSHAEKSSG